VPIALGVIEGMQRHRETIVDTAQCRCEGIALFQYSPARELSITLHDILVGHCNHDRDAVCRRISVPAIRFLEVGWRAGSADRKR
jgi:hypothetical protein